MSIHGSTSETTAPSNRRHVAPRIDWLVMKLLGMAVAMSAFVMTQAQETPPPADLMKQAQTLADTRIENFRNAINDPVARRTAFLEMQADPIAVSRLNVKDAAKNPIHEDLIQAANAESTAIREPVKARLKAEVAAKYGVSPDAVQTVEYGKTPRSNPREFGQDWDLTARVNGRNVPAPVAQKIAHQAYLDSATTVEGVNGAVKITVTDPKTGEARSITADEFTHRQSLAVGARECGTVFARG